MSAQRGGAGTVFIKASGATSGDLIVDNNNQTNAAATTQVYGTSQTFDNIAIKNDFAYAAKNRDKILAEWSKRYASKTEK